MMTQIYDEKLIDILLELEPIEEGSSFHITHSLVEHEGEKYYLFEMIGGERGVKPDVYKI